MPSSKPAPIAIVGGGPCGLTFARLLECAGIEYFVFERDPSSVPEPGYQGGTLDIHGDTGQEALRRAGLRDQFEKLARRDATTMLVQNYKGTYTAKLGEGRDAPEIDRLQLRQILLDSLPSYRIRWGKTLSAVERDTHKKNIGARNVVLRFADGSTETGFRLVVGADGAWSKVRQLITSARPEYSGIMAIEGRLSLDNPQYHVALDMVGAGSSLMISAKAFMAVQQMSDHSYRIYMGIKGPQDLTRPGGELDVNRPDKTRAALLASDGFFGDWAEHLRAFVANAEGPWRAWAWCRLNPDILMVKTGDEINATTLAHDAWRHSPGVALMGDAAHLSSPNGEGVNQAMYDALRLFDCIKAEIGDTSDMDFDEVSDTEALERALAAYEAEMLPRGREHIHDGLNMERMFFGENAAEVMVEAFMQIKPEGTPLTEA